MLTKLSSLIGALTTWMTSGGWEETGWLSSTHLIYLFKTQYKINGCMLSLYNYWCESNISASSTCTSFFSNCMIMAEILQLGITSTLQQHYIHMIEIGLKPWENTLLPWEDMHHITMHGMTCTMLPCENTLLPLQLIVVCIPDAAYD